MPLSIYHGPNDIYIGMDSVGHKTRVFFLDIEHEQIRISTFH